MILFVRITLLILISCGTCTAQVSIDAVRTIKIGGIHQYVTIKGKDNTKPLLLFLHGGPGNSVLSYAHRFTNQLEEHFIIVQWDQRQTGKTLSINESPKPLTAKQFVADSRELIDSILTVYKRPKLYLAGHSWGNYLGFEMVRMYPERIIAFFAIAPMINQLESEKVSLKILQESAKKNGNKEAMQELASVKIPFENGEQLFYHRKWLLKYMRSSAKLSKPGVQKWAATWLMVFNEASAVNLFEDAPAVGCPVYFFVGRNDFQTNSTIAEKYYQTLTAPKKDLFWFERSAHSLPTTEPDKLQRLIITLKE